MRLVSIRQEALYRGFRIEGTTDGTCILLRVIPTRPDLPRLECSRFRSLPQGTWPNALRMVCGCIDSGFKHLAQADLHASDSERVNKLLRLQDKLRSEVNRREATAMPRVGGSSYPPRVIK